MKILAIDTSTEACSAALLNGSEITEQYQFAPQQHSELILQMVETVLQQADISLKSLDAIAFGRGPGSFVGVRIATGVVQGLAYAAQLPVIPISSLAAMAQGYMSTVEESVDDLRILVAIDARMQQVYWAEYKRTPFDLVELIGAEVVQDPELVSGSDEDTSNKQTESNQITYHGVGTGWGSYQNELSAQYKTQDINGEVYPHAKDIAILAKQDFSDGKMISASEAHPVYLRNQVVKKPVVIKPVTK